MWFWIFLILYFRMKVNCSKNVRSVHIYKDASRLSFLRQKRGSVSNRFSVTALFPRKKRGVMPQGTINKNLVTNFRNTSWANSLGSLFWKNLILVSSLYSTDSLSLAAGTKINLYCWSLERRILWLGEASIISLQKISWLKNSWVQISPRIPKKFSIILKMNNSGMRVALLFSRNTKNWMRNGNFFG